MKTRFSGERGDSGISGNGVKREGSYRSVDLQFLTEHKKVKRRKDLRLFVVLDTLV